MKDKKISVEEMLEYMWSWWDTLAKREQEDILLPVYMKRHGFRAKEVEWQGGEIKNGLVRM